MVETRNGQNIWLSRKTTDPRGPLNIVRTTIILFVLIAELLSADGSLVHQACLIHGKDGNAVGEFGIGAGAGLERDGGRLGVLWNERDESVPWVADLGEAMRWPTHQPYEVGQDFTPVLTSGPFVNIERRKFSHRQLLDHEGLRQRVLTTSYIAVMDEKEQRTVMRDVHRVMDHLPETIELPYVTDVYRATAILR